MAARACASARWRRAVSCTKAVIASAIAALKMADCHAAAWCFPPECRRLDCGNDKYAPDVLLALSNTRHS